MHRTQKPKDNQKTKPTQIVIFMFMYLTGASISSFNKYQCVSVAAAGCLLCLRRHWSQCVTIAIPGGAGQIKRSSPPAMEAAPSCGCQRVLGTSWETYRVNVTRRIPIWSWIELGHAESHVYMIQLMTPYFGCLTHQPAKLEPNLITMHIVLFVCVVL